jgi:hypothetical protein
MTILLMAALAQGAGVEGWMRDLHADDAETRDTAVRKLIEAGEPARAAVTPLLKSDDPELAARARAILEGIDAQAKLRDVLGDTRTCTIERWRNCAPLKAGWSSSPAT